MLGIPIFFLVCLHLVESLSSHIVRFRPMDNLSGGEKTVAALALLFAIHRYMKDYLCEISISYYDDIKTGIKSLLG